MQQIESIQDNTETPFRLKAFGNPALHALWEDESENMTLKSIARSLHAATFERRILSAANSWREGGVKKQRR